MLSGVACNDGDAVFGAREGDFEGGGVVGISSSAPTLLRSGQSCDDVVESFRDLGADTMLGYGGIVTADVVFDEAGDDASGAAETTAAAPVAADRASSSDTNTQEAGIDEPDVVENDGDYVYTLAPTTETEELVILDAETAEVVGRVALGTWGNSMVLSGDRILAISQGGYGFGVDMPVPVPEVLPVDVNGPSGASEPGSAGEVEPVDDVDLPEPIEPPGFTVGTTMQLIDVSDRTAPRIVETTEIEGHHTTTRVVDGVARVVISSYPEIYPVDTFGDFESAMTAAIADADIDDWLPSYRTISRAEGDAAVADQGPAVGCDQVLLPDVNAGSGETSILRVDFADGFDPADTTTVVADAGAVYASSDTLYLAANRWDTTGPGGDSTAVHAFDLSGDGAATHTAAGEVPGHMLNQYSMSEFDGDLRVATTENSFSEQSESGVRVLRRDGDTLVEVGAVTGLGRTETIQSVRFMGDTAYVVTFRQTDPLYVIDLSEPTEPRAVGELKIPGFSSYLHPIGDDLLVGVGRNADDEGRDTGFLVSVFDVSDPTSPVQVDTYTDPTMWSAAGHDPKAFLWWADEGTVVIPFESDGAVEDRSVEAEGVEPYRSTGGLLVLDAGASGISERGRVSADGTDRTTWSRSLVVQGRLWGLYTAYSFNAARAGVAVTDFDSLTQISFHPFG